MSAIPSVFDLKGQARLIQKQHSCPLNVAYQKLAAQYGFRDWAALSSAAKKNGGTSNGPAEPVVPPRQRFELPAEVARWLADLKKEFPADEVDALAYRQGLIFGYDVKEAQDFEFDEVLVPGDDNGLSALTAGDLAPACWDSLMQEYLEDPELGLERAKELDAVEVIQECLYDTSLIRFAGKQFPADFQAAYALATERCFWRPLYIWFEGKFIDLQKDAPA